MKKFGSWTEQVSSKFRTSTDNKEVTIIPPATLAGASNSFTTPNITGTTDTVLSRVSVDQTTNRLQNKDLAANTVGFVDNTDTSKKLLLNLAGFTTATTRTITIPNLSDTLVTETHTQALSNKTIDGDLNTVQDLALTSLKTTGNLNVFLQRNGSGVVIDSAKAVPTGDVVGTSDTQALTGKTIDADLNTLSNIENADIKAAAAIARTKLASGTANHVIINDGTGVLSSEATLAVTRGGTGAATALAGFNALSPLTTKGDLLTRDGTNNIRVPVGTDGFALVADSTQAAGIKWSSVLANPMTTAGDIIVGGTAGAPARLGIGAANTVLGVNSAGAAQEYKAFATGTAGTDFTIAHTAGIVTFNIPDASAANRGLITTGAQTIAGSKTLSDALLIASGTAGTPGIAFSADADGSGTGIFRVAANSLGFSANGTNIGQYSSAGAWTLGASGGTQSHTVNGNTLALSGTVNPGVTITGTTNPGTWSITNRSDTSGFPLNINDGTAVRMNLTSTGRVGFNVNAVIPSYDFHVQKNSASTQSIRFENIDTTGGTSTRTTFDTNAGNVRAYWETINTAYSSFGTISNHDMIWLSNSTDRGRIAADGTWTLGSTNSTNSHVVNGAVLKILSSTGANQNPQLQIQSQSTNTGTWALVCRGDTSGAPLQIIDVDASNAVRFWMDSAGQLGIGSIAPTKLFQLNVGGTTVTEGNIQTSAALSNSIYTGWAVDSNSRRAILGLYKHSGITTEAAFIQLNPADNANNFLWVDDSDVLRISTSSANIGTTGGTVVGSQTSDERLKTNITALNYGLDEVLALQPIRYTLEGREEIGFGAQTTQSIIPEAVCNTGDSLDTTDPEAPTDKLVMEYVRIVPVLVKAVQELKTQLDAALARIEQLENV